MPSCWQTGSSSVSMPRASSEYGGCSVRKRISPRSSATWWALTTCEGGKDEQPNARILPWCTRSVRAESVSSASVRWSGRWTW